MQRREIRNESARPKQHFFLCRSTPVFSSATTTTTPHNFEWNPKSMSRVAPSQNDDMLESESGDTDQSDEVDSSQLRGVDDESDSSNCSSYGGNHHRGGVASSLSRRRNPARVSKDNFNRVCSTIMKSSSKKKRRELHTNEQTLKSIEKIYISKRMKKFTPANLETIFEEPSDENAADAEDDSEECAITSQVRLVKFGSRKLRRSISFNDGLNKNKSLIKKRRLKVKKTFGKRFALKKISMTEFHDRLNKSLDSAMFDGDDEPPSTGIAEANLDRATDIAFMDDMQLPALLAHQSLAFE